MGAMGSRKAKPKRAPARAAGTPERDAQRTVDAADADEEALRPSSTMTREVEAVTAEELIARSAAGSVPKIRSVPPPAQTEPRLQPSDDLEQTLEAPSAPRLAIMDAAETLLPDVGFAALTKEQIARAANISIDVFHAHFANKRALLRALNERFCAQAITVTNEATRSGIWDNASPRELIEVAVRSILDVVLDNAELVRAVLASADADAEDGQPGGGDAAGAKTDGVDLVEGFRQVGRNITARIMLVLDGMKVTDKPSERDVAFVFLLAVSLAHQTILVGPEWSGVDFDRDELYERMVRTVRGYFGERLS